MADYLLLKPIIRKWEGNYSNHPNDKGGETMWGITHTTYDSYRKKMGLKVRSVKFMTEEEWNEIFKTMYWDRANADQINSQSIANIIVDNIWGSGASWIKKVQEVVGVTADGSVGPKTISAINNARQEELLEKLWKRRVKFYVEICRNNPSQKKFLKGWINRLYDFKFEK